MTSLLQQGWVEKYSKEHKRKFWKNEVTGQKSWTQPTEPTIGEEIEIAGGESANMKVESVVISEIEQGTGIAEAIDDNSNKESCLDEWEEKFSEKHGKPYYQHKLTRRKSWVAPSSTKIDNKDSDDNVEHPSTDEWEEKFSEKHGRTFFLHKKTGKKSWNPPDTPPIKRDMQGDNLEKAGPLLNLVDPDRGSGEREEGEKDAEWEMKFSEKLGKPYYQHKLTRRKSWVAPPSQRASDTSNTYEESPASTNLSGALEVNHAVGVTESQELSTKSTQDECRGSIDVTEDPVSASASASASASGEERMEMGVLGGAICEWEMRQSEQHGKPYYVHKTTGKKSWLPPVPEEPAVVVVPEKDTVEFGVFVSERADGKGEETKVGNEMVGNFDSDISRIEQQESPVSSPVKQQAVEGRGGQVQEVTVASMKQYTLEELAATLNFYIKTNEVLEHNLRVADDKCAELLTQCEAHVTDNVLLRHTVHDYAAQHHAREEIILGLQAQASLSARERDEALHALQQEQAHHADREVQILIDAEAKLEGKAKDASQKNQISQLEAELDEVLRERDDLAEKNKTLNFLCEKDSRRISTLENNLSQSVRDCAIHQEKITQLKTYCASYTKKLEGVEKELGEYVQRQGGIVEKNKSLITENSILIRKVAVLQKREKKRRAAGGGEGRSKAEGAALKKSPPLRFSSFERIDIPVSMIQTTSWLHHTSKYQCRELREGRVEAEDSPLDCSFSDVSATDIDSDERFKRRAELEDGWVFVDMDHIPLRHLLGIGSIVDCQEQAESPHDQQQQIPERQEQPDFEQESEVEVQQNPEQ